MREGAVDLARLEKIRVHVAEGARTSKIALQLLEPRPLRLRRVGTGLADAHTKLLPVERAFRLADNSLSLAPNLLGKNSRRTYFIAVQNNAESRATGGLIGQFALVNVHQGRISLERTGTDEELENSPTPTPSSMGAAESWRSLGSTRAWQSVNLTPHFPDVGRSVRQLWRNQTGRSIDGVVALDSVVLRDLLAYTGPIRFRDGFKLTSQNVIDFIARDEYVRYPDHSIRKAHLSEIASVLIQRVIKAQDPPTLLRTLIAAAGSGHLHLWSSTPAEEEILISSPLGGGLPRTGDPYLAVLTQNFAGNKLDTYMRRDIKVEAMRSTEFRLEITLTNRAPLGLPSYATGRLDKPGRILPYAQNRVSLSVYGAPSSQISQVSLNGRPALMSFDHDHGHAFGTMVIEVPRQKQVRVTLVLTQPSGQAHVSPATPCQRRPVAHWHSVPRHGSLGDD